MNLFLLTCVLAAPADAPAPLPAAPAVVSAPLTVGYGGGCGVGSGCATGVCGGAQDPCPFEKKGLFAKLRNAFRPKDKCVECIPTPDKGGLFSRLCKKKPVNYCGAGGCGGGCGVGLTGCSTCGLPAIPGSPAVGAPATPVAPTPVAAPMPAPAGEKPATGKVNVAIPSVPAAMPSAKPAF